MSVKPATQIIDGEPELVCPICIENGDIVILRNVYENNGFDENPCYEVVAISCPNCGYQY